MRWAEARDVDPGDEIGGQRMRDNSPNMPRRNRFGWEEAPVILFELSVNIDIAR